MTGLTTGTTRSGVELLVVGRPSQPLLTHATRLFIKQGMSSHDHGDGPEEHAPSDPDALEPGEPHSPFWLPFLGIGLFLLGLLVFLGTRDAERELPDAAAAPSAEAPKPAP